MICSMTGFAVQQCEAGRASLHLELRSVNSRFLDLVLRIGDDLRQFEPQLREALTARLARGKVECRFNLQVDGGGAAHLSINPALLEQLRHAQGEVRAQLPEAAPLSVAEVLRWPGMLAEDRIDADTLRPQVARLLDAALEDFVASRRREGDKLAAMIRERVTAMRALVARAAPRIPEVVADYQTRLTTRLREAVATLDEERIRQEVAVFAQRVDVDEELNRLVAHLDEVERILDAGGQAGKRLDFLMQELNREANTLASKSVAGDLSAIAMDMKVLIEQMREQVQNIE